MGAGKTEYSARVWRDSMVALRKSAVLRDHTAKGSADRRKVFVIRSRLDRRRFGDIPDDALAYRGGYERCSGAIAQVANSFELERCIAAHPDFGTWIIDEAGFYEERLAYVVQRESESRGVIFIFPTLILNFRRAIFNPTAALLLEHSTDVFPLTAYCEHNDCLRDAFYSYRYYIVDGHECPALFFDPLIIIDSAAHDVDEPKYCARCEEHHLLPGKEYTFLTLKPLGETAARGDLRPLLEEIERLHSNLPASQLYADFQRRYADERSHNCLNALRLPRIAERALVFLFAEQNLISQRQLVDIVERLQLDTAYLSQRLSDNRRPVEFGGQ